MEGFARKRGHEIGDTALRTSMWRARWKKGVHHFGCCICIRTKGGPKTWSTLDNNSDNVFFMMPSLDDAISDLFPDPWTLADVIAYLSKSHCLETIQFLEDATRYRVCHAEIVDNDRIPEESRKCHYDYLQDQWENLLTTYILPNGERELNLPCDVRARLLEAQASDSQLPPHPSELDSAVKIVRELLEGSILCGVSNSDGSPEPPSDEEGSGWRKISSKILRKPSPPVSGQDQRGKLRISTDLSPTTFTWRDKPEAPCCTRLQFLGDTPDSPQSHLSRRAMDIFNHTIRRVRSKRQLKSSPEKAGVVDNVMGAKSQFLSP